MYKMFHNFNRLSYLYIKFILFCSFFISGLIRLFVLCIICYMCAIYRCILILRITNSTRGPVTKTKNKIRSKINETPDVTLAYNNQLIEMRLSVKLLAISSEVYVCSGFSFNNTYLHLSIYICFFLLCIICFVVCTFLSPLTPSFFPHSCYQIHK